MPGVCFEMQCKMQMQCKSRESGSLLLVIIMATDAHGTCLPLLFDGRCASI